MSTYKNYYFIFALILLVIFLSTCSSEEESTTESTTVVCSDEEIFCDGSTNYNIFCESFPVSNNDITECKNAWSTGISGADNFEYIAKSWTPLNAINNSNQVFLYNFTPVAYEDVTISDSSGTIAANIEVASWSRKTFSHTTSGEISIDIPTEKNSVMLKFQKIKTKWSWAPTNYDPDGTHQNWWTGWTGEALKAFYTMNYNMAYFLSSTNFENVIVNDNITYADANVTWHDSSWGEYDNNSVIVSRMRENDAVFRLGIVHGGNPSGLGGGNVLGVAPHVLKDQMSSDSWTRLGWNGADIWFHEFSHCFGFSHSSNMTYPQTGNYTSDIPAKVQKAMVAAYNSDNNDVVCTWRD